MASGEKELEDQLIEVGNNLLQPPRPPDDDELLTLLDQVESLLSKVEQSPSVSMEKAIAPLMEALVANELLKHSNMDVKVSVASCISEITRITAPEAPYNDEEMKKIFLLIVAAFEKLPETSDRSYSKRISILETVAKVRSCVVMLDLDCDALILDMFHHFLETIRDVHPESVFMSMETIMSLVIEESEDISPEILSPLLNSVKKENQDVLPIARRLAEAVLEKCASKLKPYLMQIVEAMGMSPNDYSEVVASICQETSDKVEHSEVISEELMGNEIKSEKNASDEPQVTKEMDIDAACSGEVDPLVVKPSKLVTSNGVSKPKDDDSLIGLISPKKKPEIPLHTTSSSKAKSDSLDSKILISETKPDKATKKTKERQKHSSSMQSIQSPAHSRVDSDTENKELLDGGKSCSKETSNSVPEGPSIGEPAGHSGQVTETPAKLSSPAASHNEAVIIASPSRSQCLPDGTRSKRGRGGPSKKEKIKQDTALGSPSEPKESSLREVVEDEVPPSADILKKDSEGTSDADVKPYRRSGKKTVSKKANADKTALQKGASSKDSGPTNVSETEPLKQLVEKVDTSDTEEEPSVKKLGAKKARGKTISEKDVTADPSRQSTPKLKNKQQGLLNETPKSNSKRKRTPAKEEASGKSLSVEELDEKIVGSRIKVWWPKDHMYYEGVIDSFDPIKKKHKVLYVDGDVEVLNLIKQRWEFVGGNSDLDEKQATDMPGEEQIDEKPQKKKGKTNSDSLTKPTKTDASLKRGKGTSTSKSNVEATTSSDELKDDDKLISISKEIIPKTARKTKSVDAGKLEETTSKTCSKSKEGTSKMGSQSKDDLPKTDTKSKNDSAVKTEEKTTKSKTGSKSKDATLKIGSKSKADTPKTSTKSKDEIGSESEEKHKSVSKSKEATLKLGSKSKAETPKASTKSKDEGGGESEEKTKSGSKSKDATLKLGSKSKDEGGGESEEKTKSGSKSKDATVKLGSKSKDEGGGESEEKTKSGSKSKDATLKLGSKSKDEGAGESEENSTKTKIGSKLKDGTSKLGSKSKDKDQSAGKSKENTTKTGSKSRDSTPKLGSKTKDADAPKTSSKSKSEAPKTDKKPVNKNGSSSKGKSGSSNVQESNDLGKEKLVDSAKPSEQESENKSGKKRRRK